MSSFDATPKYIRALIFGASRCGLAGVSVTSPPPWNDAPAPIRSGDAAEVLTASAHAVGGLHLHPGLNDRQVRGRRGPGGGGKARGQGHGDEVASRQVVRRLDVPVLILFLISHRSSPCWRTVSSARGISLRFERTGPVGASARAHTIGELARPW